ncbi:MAG: hypothetical protein ACD_2C00073G0023 [uncultured bacterium (gcode 4)]|uniref:Hflx-type G domain-containing protein n=1 Tax=uncultured bacterium (gcode 4) TaxID=1234023 RepID=K2H262_9BACT|nr:MAG: hypothetical protein ACD_2C00073G0023 [uncultured bacterium (gcode 4)]
MKVILVDIVPHWTKEEEYEDRMIELENLVSTYGSLVVLKRLQKRNTPDYHTFVGSGKLEEVMHIWDEIGADLVIIWNILKPAQIYHINDIFEKSKSKLKAWDRVDLILKIFEMNANSPEARLQIELAAIKHMWPRIFWMWLELSRQGWGWSWAMRWLWETNTEIMKRHLRENEKKILEKLDVYAKTRAQHRQSRKRKELKTIWIVGYTNAWKSSLMNALTHKWVLAENKLFATLWTSVGKMYIETPDYKGKEVLLNDTIWFIRDLPPSLIKAFSSTLEDSIESDVLLHVIDSTDRKVAEKIKVVEDTLSKIWASQPRIYVFNKIDMIDDKKIKSLKKEFKHLNPIFISAFNKIWFEELKNNILKYI